MPNFQELIDRPARRVRLLSSQSSTTQSTAPPADGRRTLSLQLTGIYHLDLAVTASRVGALDIRFRPNN